MTTRVHLTHQDVPQNETTPQRLHALGATTHEEHDLMSTHHDTDTTTAERAFWTDLRRVTDEHDTGDLSLAAKLVHDAAVHVSEPQSDDSLGLDVSAFRAAAYDPTPDLAALEGAVQRITDAIGAARRLDDIETKLDAVLAALGESVNAGRTVFSALEQVEDTMEGGLVASLRRDRLVLDRLEGPTGRTPADDAPPAWDLEDRINDLDFAEAEGAPDGIIRERARRIVDSGGVLPITINDDGSRRA